MARAPKSAGVDPALKKAISAELKNIHEKDGDKYKMPLMDRMRVYGVALKLAAIEAKMDDAGFGSAFGDDKEE